MPFDKRFKGSKESNAAQRIFRLEVSSEKRKVLELDFPCTAILCQEAFGTLNYRQGKS